MREEYETDEFGPLESGDDKGRPDYKIIGTTEIAQCTGLSARQVRRLATANKIPWVIIRRAGKRNLKFELRPGLEKWIEEHTVELGERGALGRKPRRAYETPNALFKKAWPIGRLYRSEFVRAASEPIALLARRIKRMARWLSRQEKEELRAALEPLVSAYAGLDRKRKAR